MAANIDELNSRLEKKQLDMLASLAAAFWRNTLDAGDRTAFVLMQDDRVQEVTWNQLGKLVDAAMHQLEYSGVLPAQHVASCLGNTLDWIAIDLACQTLGCVHVPIDARLPVERVRELVAHSESVAFLDGLEQCLPDSFEVLGVADCQRRLAQASALRCDEPATLLYTSGSSDRPKGVLLSHRNTHSNALAKLDAAPQQQQDLRLNLLPFSHAYARTCEFATWILTAGQLAIAEDWERFLLHAHVLNPTLVNLVPYLAERAAGALDGNPAALGTRLRLLQIGGAAVTPALYQRLATHGLPPLQGYGLTEASPVVCSNRAGDQRIGTVGPAVLGTDIRLDEEGRLWTRGPHVMLGYWRDPQATRQAIVNGWLCTGDLAEYRSCTSHGELELYILGRQSEQICLSTGYKVSPEVVESRLMMDDWIEHAVVLGDRRAHIAVLVWPHFESIPAEHFVGGSRRTLSTLIESRWLLELRQRIAQRFQNAPRYETPECIALLSAPPSAADDTATLKGTPRRHVIEQRHHPLLQSLYA